MFRSNPEAACISRPSRRGVLARVRSPAGQTRGTSCGCWGRGWQAAVRRGWWVCAWGESPPRSLSPSGGGRRRNCCTWVCTSRGTRWRPRSRSLSRPEAGGNNNKDEMKRKTKSNEKIMPSVKQWFGFYQRKTRLSLVALMTGSPNRYAQISVVAFAFGAYSDIMSLPLLLRLRL